MEDTKMKQADRKLDSREPAEVAEAIWAIMTRPTAPRGEAPPAPSGGKRPNPWRWSAFAH
jgi:hypothetical protein